MDGYIAIDWGRKQVCGPVRFTFQGAAADLPAEWPKTEVVNVEIEEN